MADILIRANDTIGGVSPFGDECAPFYRGYLLKDVAQGDRVYFVAKGTDHGQPKGTGAIIAYATFQDYRDFTEEYTEAGQTKIGTKPAYIVQGPRTPIKPPVSLTGGYTGNWRARYVQHRPRPWPETARRHDEVDLTLRCVHPPNGETLTLWRRGSEKTCRYRRTDCATNLSPEHGSGTWVPVGEGVSHVVTCQILSNPDFPG